MVDLPNIKNYPKETKRIYLIICIFAAFLNKRLANKMKKGLPDFPEVLSVFI